MKSEDEIRNARKKWYHDNTTCPCIEWGDYLETVLTTLDWVLGD